jgi:hypothetical protein
MEGAITSSTFSEKDNKIEISKNSDLPPKFEDIVEIENYYNKNINDSISNEPSSKKKPKKLRFCCKIMGHTLCLLSDKYGNPLIMIGPHWPMYVCFCGLISAGYGSFFYHFFNNLNLFFKLFGIGSYALYFLSYTGVFLLNPGYPVRDENSIKGQPKKLYKYCVECGIWERIDRSISHCVECGVCIEGYDHHCAWTGKCIGRKTILYFYTFVTSVFVVFLFFMSGLIYIDYKGNKKAL